jgi:hypothetical protein
MLLLINNYLVAALANSTEHASACPAHRWQPWKPARQTCSDDASGHGPPSLPRCNAGARAESHAILGPKPRRPGQIWCATKLTCHCQSQAGAERSKSTAQRADLDSTRCFRLRRRADLAKNNERPRHSRSRGTTGSPRRSHRAEPWISPAAPEREVETRHFRESRHLTETHCEYLGALSLFPPPSAGYHSRIIAPTGGAGPLGVSIVCQPAR